MKQDEEFLALLDSAWPELSPAQRQGVSAFRDALIEESSRQNLTKLLSPQDFIDGHLLDVRSLLGFSGLEFPAMDMGSGCGVPGLLAAIIQEQAWVLAESEMRKAEFLSRCVDTLKIQNRVSVFHGRAEDYLRKQGQVKSVVARAVGPVSQIYGWIQKCSTWNSLILLKGPKWDEEWKGFLSESGEKQLILSGKTEYRVGVENKQRIIVRLDRVPRGTKVNKH